MGEGLNHMGVKFGHLHGNSLQVSTFQVGKYFFGIDVSRVQEVLRAQKMTPGTARSGGDTRIDQSQGADRSRARHATASSNRGTSLRVDCNECHRQNRRGRR